MHAISLVEGQDRRGLGNLGAAMGGPHADECKISGSLVRREGALIALTLIE